MITYFENKNKKSSKKYENFKILTKLLKSIITFGIIPTISTSNKSSVTGIGSKVIPISPALE